MKPFAIFLVFILLSGCESGAQRGKFAVGGNSTEALAHNAGHVSKFVGTPIDQLGSPRKLLVALIVLGSSVDAGQSSHQKYISSQEYTVGSTRFSVVWDRRDDQISLNSTKFDRGDGNVFVIRLVNGKPTITQCQETIDSQLTSDILDVAKQSNPNASDIRSLAPYPE